MNDWLKSLPLWQQDLLYHLAEGVELDEIDFEKVASKAKGTVGLGVEQECHPVSIDHLDSIEGDEGQVILNQLGPLKGIDRLAESQTMTIPASGLTVVYGANGSGKSGYCRILKNLCYSVGSTKTIVRGDIYTDEVIKQEVNIKFTAGGKSVDYLWDAKSEPDDRLKTVSVFDSQAAGLYVNENNKIEFLPKKLHLITKFRSALEEINIQIKEEKKGLVQIASNSIFEKFNEGTPAAHVVSALKEVKLSELPEAKELDAFKIFSKENNKRLQELRVQLANDPESLAEKYKSTRSSVELVAASLKRAELTFEVKKINALRGDLSKIESLKRSLAAEVASMQENYSVPGTGSAAWRDMYAAARKFAVEAGFENPFSAAAKGESCVLCQGSLDEDAARRLREFDAFVESEIQTKIASISESLNSKVSEICKVELPNADLARERLKALNELSEKRLQLFVEYIKVKKAHDIVKEKLKNLEIPDDDELDVFRSNLSGDWSKLNGYLGEMSRTYAKEPSDNPLLAAMRAELAALEDHKLLADNIDLVKYTRDNLYTAKKLGELLEGINLTKVSAEITKIRKEVLTNEMNSALQDELYKLKIGHLPVTLNDNSSGGVSNSYIDLGFKIKGAKKSDILSEGEQRALALACFLAEVNSVVKSASLVIDDPVSSLDENRIRTVAQRLAEEAASGRQVVVFTHSMYFMSELKDAAAERKTPCTTNYIYHQGGLGFGVVECDAQPWETMSTKARLNRIRQDIDCLTDNLPPEEYKEKTRFISSRLRETWEQAVEENLFQGVVKRFSRTVQTMMLHSVEVTIDDFRDVYFGMKRSSEWSGHDNPDAAPLTPPDKAELLEAVEALNSFSKRINGRTESLSKTRKTSVH